MKPKRFANLTSVCFTCGIYSLPITALYLYSSYKRNHRIRMYLQLYCWLFSWNFASLCVLATLAFFPYGSLFRPRILQRLYFFLPRCSLFAVAFRRPIFFAALCHFQVFLLCVQYPRPLERVQPLLQSIISSYAKNSYSSTAPPFFILGEIRFKNICSSYAVSACVSFNYEIRSPKKNRSLPPNMLPFSTFYCNLSWHQGISIKIALQNSTNFLDSCLIC